MQRHHSKRSARARRARRLRRNIAFILTAAMACAALVAGAWHLGLFGRPVSAEAATPSRAH